MTLKTVTALMLVSTIAFAQTESAAPAAQAPAAATEAKPAPVKKAKKAKKAKKTSEVKLEVAPVAATPAPATTTAVAAPAANQTTATTSLKTEQDKSDLKKIDEDITNAKMRAELGANKKYSFQAALSYSGSTVEKPFAEVRPPIRAGMAERQVPASLSGTISGKYKVNANNSLSLNTGVSVATPFHGTYDQGNKIANPVKSSAKKEIDRFNVADPSLSYTYAGKLGELMSITSVEATYYTTSAYVDDGGMVAGLDLSQTVAGDFSGWTLGAYIGLSKTFYKADLTQDQKDGETLVSMYMSPFAEYAFNDTYSFRTVLNYFAWDIAANGPQGSASGLNPQQSMGLGMSVTRDIYVYPNVQFMPFNLRADLTNVGLSTTINL